VSRLLNANDPPKEAAALARLIGKMAPLRQARDLSAWPQALDASQVLAADVAASRPVHDVVRGLASTVALGAVKFRVRAANMLCHLSLPLSVVDRTTSISRLSSSGSTGEPND
jgi:hypothetical protein